jgi:solute carrier family 25 (mitochondrial carrier protein), member 16
MTGNNASGGEGGRCRISPTEKQQSNWNEKALKSLIAGGLAGCVAKTVIGPFDRVKILFQVQSPLLKEYTGIHKIHVYGLDYAIILIDYHSHQFFLGRVTGVFRAIALIFRHDGMYGLYRGHSAMLLRIFPYSAINYFAYEKYKKVRYFLFALCKHERIIILFSSTFWYVIYTRN